MASSDADDSASGQTQVSTHEISRDDKSREDVYLEDSAWSWMFRGMILGVMLIGSANALSFFYRSQGWGSLLGSRKSYDEAIGFPFAIWEEGSGYASHTMQTSAFVIMLLTTLVVGGIAGGAAVLNRRTLNRIMNRMASQGTHDTRLQFSLSGLMIATVLAAVAAAIARTFTPRVEVLGAIYALGPITLVALAFLPRKLSWQQRVAILTPMTFMLIAVAITLGNALSIEFDKVLLGIFICWTPQAAISAIALTAWLLSREYRDMVAESHEKLVS